MWVCGYTPYYWTLCETMNGKYKDYHVQYFPFLSGRQDDIETIHFTGYSVPMKFLHLTQDEIEQLRVFDLIDKINYN